MVAADPLRPTTLLIVGLLTSGQRYDLINHIVDGWEREQLTTAVTEDLQANYEGDLHGFGQFIENSYGSDEAILEALKEIGVLDS